MASGQVLHRVLQRYSIVSTQVGSWGVRAGAPRESMHALDHPGSVIRTVGVLDRPVSGRLGGRMLKVVRAVR